MGSGNKTGGGNGSKKKFSRTGLVLVGCSLVCVILALAVGLPNGFLGDGGKGGDLDDENTPGIQEIMDGESPLMVFDKRESTKSLMEAFDNGTVEKVTLLYSPVTGVEEKYEKEQKAGSTDQKEIREVYRALKNVSILEETEPLCGAAAHTVIFRLEDGTEAEFYFSGEDENAILCLDEGSYTTKGTEGLWEQYDQMLK